MIAFATGDTNIIYAKITFSSTSPYNMATSGAVKGTNPYNNMRIRGLHIKSSSILIAAFIEERMPYEFSIATVDYSLSSVSFKETLPKRGNTKMRRVVFLSDTLYFVASY
jgi:hypothetical protein